MVNAEMIYQSIVFELSQSYMKILIVFTGVETIYNDYQFLKLPGTSNCKNTLITWTIDNSGIV